MKNIEIERKFLLESLPEHLQQQSHEMIRQGYITIDNHTEVRVRAKGDVYFLTVKQGSGLSRTEVEIDITALQFSALWELTVNKRVEKNRYLLKDSGTLIEIDIYCDGLAPLKVAEVEFNSIEASRAFKVPAFFGLEVTDDKAYKNAALAVYGIPDSYIKDLT